MVDLILIAIIVFGFINSYTDLKYSKIKNVLIILMILSSAVLNFYLNSFTYETIINSSISLALGFFLFYLNYWSAGDAKLFFAFSLLVPISVYHFGKVSYFPSISILINAFVPVTIYYLLKSVTTLKIKNLVNILKDQLKPKTLLATVLFLFGFPFIFNFFNLKLDVISSVFILLLLFQVLKKFPKKYSLVFFVSLSILNLLFYPDKILVPPFFYNFILSVIIYQIFNLALSFLFTLSFSNQFLIDKLKPGMILGEPLFELGNKFSKKSKKGEKITKLSQEDISLLNKLYKSGKLDFKTLLIERTVPFAPFIFIGVLLTYLVQGNLFSYVYLIYLKPYFATLLS
ncbi:MAG: prepilin peptidase [Candidatus Aenigmarchaeota archaeon]|nr:prepilin peptidase [Candidatus Aenigmarchaeota archaeon]